MQDIIVYKNGELELKVSVNSETIWLSQMQLVELFDKNQSVISRHINNIFKDAEVNKKSNMQKMHIANSDKPVNFYSLDIVLAVGYRTNSVKAIKFRQWATRVLKSYISDGYVINQEKITQKRLLCIENDIQDIKSHIKNNTFELTQGVFYNGQIYDAYAFVNDIFKLSKVSITLIDNYIDDSVLTLFSKYPKITFKIITSNISKQLKLDINKYNSQYNNLEININKTYHDRFIIIDSKELYHLGASLKDLGKKVFAFSKMDIDTFKLSNSS